jgi:hypothetical protein
VQVCVNGIECKSELRVSKRGSVVVQASEVVILR